MNEDQKPKNLVHLNGVPYYSRWTILEVPEKTVNIVKAFASEHKHPIGKALELLIDKATADGRHKEIIVLDYWQTISHYQEYFKEFAQQMLDAGHEVHIVTAVGEERAKRVFADINKTGVPHTKKHKVIFKDPSESPALKLKKCQQIGATVIYDDRDDVCRLMNKNGIVAMRVTRKDNSTYDLESEIK
jgi:hypothetical protein